jgi:hypothetical protein
MIITAAACGTQDYAVATVGRRLAQGDLEGARVAYRLARRIPIPADNLWCSQQLAALARRVRSPWREDAIVLAKEASAAAENGGEQRFNGLYQSAVLAVITNDLGAAQAKLRTAIDAAPWWYRAHMMLARVLWLAGQWEEAEHQADLAVKCAGRLESQVKLALAEARSMSRPAAR